MEANPSDLLEENKQLSQKIIEIRGLV